MVYSFGNSNRLWVRTQNGESVDVDIFDPYEDDRPSVILPECPRTKRDCAYSAICERSGTLICVIDTSPTTVAQSYFCVSSECSFVDNCLLVGRCLVRHPAKSQDDTTSESS